MVQPAVGKPALIQDRLAVVYWDDARPNEANYADFQFGYHRKTATWWVIISGQWQPVGQATEAVQRADMRLLLMTLVEEIQALRQGMVDAGWIADTTEE